MNGTSHFLGPLADPATPMPSLELQNVPTDALMAALNSMLRIRLAEEAVAGLVEAGEAKCPCHLGIGQEAVAVGVSMILKAGDRVYGTHRSHSHYLAQGGSLDAMMAEILGKASGASRGMGGSMHLYAPNVGFEGSVPIVGATIPIAAGAALAAKMDGKGAMAVAYFGDGACEEGVFHEAMNMAAVMKLPLLFVCENNLYSSHLDIKLRQPADSVARFARAHAWHTEVVDGNDVIAVKVAAQRLADAARQANGPGFLEAVTFRWRGHVGPSENVDVGLRRSAEELAAWKRRDPVARLAAALISERNAPVEVLETASSAIHQQVESAVTHARSALYPEPRALLDYVYAEAVSR
jgi:acetoin:2,6-dichlorophenolindophenol oxidoreductase subunit alpha